MHDHDREYEQVLRAMTRFEMPHMFRGLSWAAVKADMSQVLGVPRVLVWLVYKGNFEWYRTHHAAALARLRALDEPKPFFGTALFCCA
jgi:hypothetical protein